MSNYLIQSETLANIADAIREKTGSTDQLSPTAMASAIAGIQAGGGDDGSFKGVIERTATNPVLPSDLTSIANYAFYKYTNLVNPVFPEGLTSIGGSAFYDCTRLALTSLPDGLTDIGSSAFTGCTNLSEITFKGTPSSISSNAFNNCTNLIIINVPWAEGAVSGAPWGATNATINYNYTGG